MNFSIARGALLAAALALGAQALDLSKLKPSGYVNDFAHVLDRAGAARLEAYCANLERVTGAQMAIVIIDSLDGEPVEDVTNNLYRQWGVGKKGKDEGIMILLAVKDHKDRAEIGYGLEPVIPDGAAGGILRGVRPILRQGAYGPALLAAAEEFGQRVADSKGVSLGVERTARPVRRTPRGIGIPWPLIIFGIFFLVSILGRLGGGRGGGGFTGFLAGMFLGNLMGRSSGWGGGGFGGYDRGGGSDSGGGFGGFGGGDSGGGGASSDW